MLTRRKLREKLTFDFTWATIDPQVGEMAAKAVVINAKDPDEAILLLDMLGLVHPQAGNEPKKRVVVKAEDDLDRERKKAQLKKTREESKKKIKMEQLRAAGIEPHEIGE